MMLSKNATFGIFIIGLVGLLYLAVVDSESVKDSDPHNILEVRPRFKRYIRAVEKAVTRANPSVRKIKWQSLQKSGVLNSKVRKVPSTALYKLLISCRRRSCKVQSKQAKARKESVIKNMKNDLKSMAPKKKANGKGKHKDLAANPAELNTAEYVSPEKIVKMVQEAKVKILKMNNLTGVVPEDDGLWSGDILLTAEQTAALLTGIKEPPKRRFFRPKRSTWYFEGLNRVNVDWKWKSPIPYAFSQGAFTTSEIKVIESAIRMFESQTCVRFRKVLGLKGSHIIFRNCGNCGYSYVGKQLNAGQTVCVNLRGGCGLRTVLHETGHALGLHHEHERFDRDNYLDIKWDNINPQKYDAFIDNIFVWNKKSTLPGATDRYEQTFYYETSYGVPYDYMSIMHYQHNMYAMNGATTLYPRKNPSIVNSMGKMSQLSQRDVMLINKMYCKPDSCKDESQYCDYWALYKGACSTTSPYYPYMKTNCRRSCSFC